MTPGPSQNISPNTHHKAEYRWRRSQLPEILLRVPKRIKVKQEPIVVVVGEEDSNIITIADEEHSDIIVIED